MNATKKCPLCAEEIPLAGVSCEFCGAQFNVTCTGYCQTCHKLGAADADGLCKVCENPVLDFHVESALVGELAPATKPAPPPPVSQPAQPKSELMVLPIKGEGVSNRYASLILDGALIGLLFMATLFLSRAADAGLPDFSHLKPANLASYFTLVNGNEKVLLALPAIWFFYYFLCETAFSTTPGKASLALQVIRKDGGRVRWWQAALRALLAPLDLLIGAFFIWLTPLKQRIGDLLAGTLVVNREKIHKAEFNPPAISFQFHNYRRVEMAEITQGIVYKFGMIRELVLRGISMDGKPVKLRLYGQLFRPQFDMLRLNIEHRYALKFPEKIIFWRLTVVILTILLGVSCVLVMVTYMMDESVLPAAAEIQPGVLPATQTALPSATLRPTATRIPAKTATPRPVEVTFDSLANTPDGRPVILVGRLALMSSTRCTSQTCALLLENPDKPSQKITIFVSVGTGPNHMKPLPDTYTKSDIQVILNDGSLAVVGHRLRITGKACKTTTNEACISAIRIIELFQVK